MNFEILEVEKDTNMILATLTISLFFLLNNHKTIRILTPITKKKRKYDFIWN